MESLTPVLLVLTGIAGAAFWIRERRTWQRFHAAAGHRPESAARLHSELRRAGVRSRYKMAGTGVSMFHGHRSAVQTPVVLVHRDDLDRAHQVRSAVQLKPETAV